MTKYADQILDIPYGSSIAAEAGLTELPFIYEIEEIEEPPAIKKKYQLCEECKNPMVGVHSTTPTIKSAVYCWHCSDKRMVNNEPVFAGSPHNYDGGFMHIDEAKKEQYRKYKDDYESRNGGDYETLRTAYAENIMSDEDRKFNEQREAEHAQILDGIRVHDQVFKDRLDILNSDFAQACMARAKEKQLISKLKRWHEI